MTSSMAERKKLIQGVLLVGIGLGVPQALAYAASVFAARLLDPSEFGAFGAMQGITQIATPIGLAMQAVTARKLANKKKTSFENLLKFGLEVSIFIFIFTIFISYPLSAIFQIEYIVLVLTIGAIAPFVFISTQLGIAQGKEFYSKLAWIYVVFGIGRSISAIVGLLIYPKLISVGLGFFCGTFLSAIIAQFILGHRNKFWKSKRTANSSTELIRATQVLFSLYVLVNIDVLLARIVLSPIESGIYSVGMLVAKIAFFLPQAFTVVLFPKMGKFDSSALKLATLGTAILCSIYILICYFASELVVFAIGGTKYQELFSEVWYFALEGTLFSILQVLLYGRIAREDSRAAVLLWFAIVFVVFVTALNINNVISLVLTLTITTFILVIFVYFSQIKKRKYF